MKIAPRLLNGQSRIPGYSGLPPELRRLIDRIARKEKCSRSWVIEQIILEWADIRVDYRTAMVPKSDEEVVQAQREKLKEKEREKYR